MNDNNSGEFGAFLAGFVIGGLVGAAVALVLAPQSGSETRSQIAGMSHDLREAGTERVNQVRSGGDDYLQQFEQSEGDESLDVQEQARIILDSGRKQAESAENTEAPTDS